MRHNFSLAKAIIFTVVVLTFTACSKGKKDMLAKNWKATELTLAGNVKLSGDQVSLVYSFKSDGTFSRTEDGKTEDGKWTLEKGDTEVELKLNNGTELEKIIKELTDEKLVWEGEEMTMQRTEVFAPAK